MKKDVTSQNSQFSHQNLILLLCFYKKKVNYTRKLYNNKNYLLKKDFMTIKFILGGEKDDIASFTFLKKKANFSKFM